jgi:hypothetical protein
MKVLAHSLRIVAATGYALFIALTIRDGLSLSTLLDVLYFFMAVAPRPWLLHRKAIFVFCLGIACIPVFMWAIGLAGAILVETGIVWRDDSAFGCVFDPVLTRLFLAFQITVALSLPASLFVSWKNVQNTSRGYRRVEIISNTTFHLIVA